MRNLQWLFLAILVCGLAIGVSLGCRSATSSSSAAPAADDDDDASPGDDDASPVEAKWVWKSVPGAICRDGSGTGLLVREIPGATNLVIFMQGGGACYSASSCADNPAHFSEADFYNWVPASGSQGIFNTAQAANPVRDWNFVYIPYCTGDLFAGSKTNGVAPGVPGTQQFVGYLNMQKMLAEIHALFPSPTRVLLAGESAGGFGVMLNYAHTARAYPGIPVALIDDSGPLFSDADVLSPCLQLLVVVLWDATGPIKDGCNCVDAQGGFWKWHAWLAENFPLGTFGLFSSMEDATIRSFFGIGQDHCAGTTDIPANVYSAGLIDLRTNVLAPTKRWSSYYINGDSHTALPIENMYYNTNVGGVPLTTWVKEVLTSVPEPVGP
jgi:hypothetical protein